MTFDFWKNDHDDLHFTLTDEELVDRFKKFIKFKSRIWIRRSYGAPAIAAFMIHELEATYDEKQTTDLLKLLIPIMYERLKPYLSGIDPLEKSELDGKSELD